MLNATLTVEEGKANSHKKCGWQTFTDAVITYINKKRSGVIFLLWGGFAQKKGKFISRDKHHVIAGVHPSPLGGSAWNGCGHFKQVNDILEESGQDPIDWTISK